MRTVTDFHSHILPGIDDGSASVEESIAMLRMEAEQGIRRVVATPHFYAGYDSPERFLENRDRAEALLRAEMARHDGMPELLIGAEVYFFRGMSESDLLPQLTIREKSCILIEMPPAPWPEDLLRELENIHARRGIMPIIAHIDRYIGPFRTYGLPQRLAQLPVLVQANASFFLERGTASMAMRMLKADQIQLLGSDCHNITTRKPNLSTALDRIQRKLGPGAVAGIREYEETILGAQAALPGGEEME